MAAQDYRTQAEEKKQMKSQACAIQHYKYPETVGNDTFADNKF